MMFCVLICVWVDTHTSLLCAARLDVRGWRVGASPLPVTVQVPERDQRSEVWWPVPSPAEPSHRLSAWLCGKNPEGDFPLVMQ